MTSSMTSMTTRTTTTRSTRPLARLCATWIALSVGAAHADPAADALRDRIEDELLSDGVSLARLGQRLELRASGAALEVVIADRGTGAVVASRVVDKLPALPAAATAELTVVVSGLLRERGLIAADSGADWGATFPPATVVAYLRPASVAVLVPAQPGRPGAEAGMAASALAAAYRRAGVAVVKVGSALGAITEVDDAMLVARAAVLAVDEVAVVRAFVEGPVVRAVVAVYAANGQLATRFAGVAGQAIPMPIDPAPASSSAAPGAPATTPPPAASDRVADQVMLARGPGWPMPDRDGVVRLWVTSKEPYVQLLRTSVAPVSVGVSAGVVVTSSVVCRAPCGTVVDGSMGETFTFGLKEVPRTDTFQLLGRKGDVTAKVKPANLGLRVASLALLGFGGVSALGGAALANGPQSDVATASLVGGAAAMLVGYLLYNAGSPEIEFRPGRPK